MAGVVIAPWLETKPTDYLAATESGARTGLEARGQDIAQQETNARLQQAAAEQAQATMLAQQKIAAARDIAANRLGLASSLAARKFQAQQEYQRAISGGMDPIQAMMNFGPGMGQSMAGVGTLGLAQARERMAQVPPQLITDPATGAKAWSYNGQIKPVPPAKATAPDFSAKDQAASIAKLVAAGLSKEEAIAQVNELAGNTDDEETTGGGDYNYTYDPDSGDFTQVQTPSDSQ